MAEEILNNEILRDEELDNVAGGTVVKSFDDADRFEALGIHVYCTDPRVPLKDLYTETMITLQDTYGRFGVKAMTFSYRANRVQAI